MSNVTAEDAAAVAARATAPVGTCNLRSALMPHRNHTIRVLTSGTSPHIGWERGTLSAVEADHLVLVDGADGAPFVLVPFAHIARVQVMD